MTVLRNTLYDYVKTLIAILCLHLFFTFHFTKVFGGRSEGGVIYTPVDLPSFACLCACVPASLLFHPHPHLHVGTHLASLRQGKHFIPSLCPWSLRLSTLQHINLGSVFLSYLVVPRPLISPACLLLHHILPSADTEVATAGEGLFLATNSHASNNKDDDPVWSASHSKSYGVSKTFSSKSCLASDPAAREHLAAYLPRRGLTRWKGKSPATQCVDKQVNQ